MACETSHGELNSAIKYNPHLWGPEELRAIFVVRQTDLDDIVNGVRCADPKEVPQHYLICGYRGMGKSTLLRRITLAIQDDADLSRHWLPLNFPEEQYTVRTLSELLLNVLDMLADSLERTGASLETLAYLDQRIAAIAALPSEQAETAALAYLRNWMNEQQRGLVLLVDSSDLLLQSLAAGEGKSRGDATALWRLRNILSHQPGLLWIGASYQALESNHQYQDAFHDFFSLHELRPLKLDEMRLALIALARRFGAGRSLKGDAAAEEMAHILDSKPERLQTLRLLSGGNPRTTVMLYELFAAGGEDSIQTDLKRLLDVMTPLYKARMEALSEQARKILAHIMESWGPVGLRELEQVSGISKTTISSQLTRLEVEGLIEKAALAGGEKRNGYQISERFFNVWYLMRNGSRRLRQRLGWAVEFMRMWFSRHELAALASHRASRHLRQELNDVSSLEWSRAMAVALGDDETQSQALNWSVMLSAHREAFNTRQAVREALPEALFDLEDCDQSFKNAKDYLERFAALDQGLAACPVVPATERDNWINDVKSSFGLMLSDKETIALNALSLTRSEYDRLRQAFATERQRCLNIFGSAACEVYAAVGAGEFFPDAFSAQLAVGQMNVRFSSNLEAYKTALKIAVRNCKEKGGLEAAFHHCILANSMDALLWSTYGSLLSTKNRYPEAEAAYRRAIALDAEYSTPWHNLGNLLQNHPNRYAEAETAYQQATRLNPENLYALADLARLEARQGHESKASSLYRDLTTQMTPAAPQVLLQAHLWLNNQDAATGALNQLCQSLNTGEDLPFYYVMEQCWECCQIGRGQALVNLMAASPWADLLLTFRVALIAVLNNQAPVGAAPEILALADEVKAKILENLSSR